MTPISHPANVLVMGPGGYRFVDYIKVGVPLTILVLIVTLLVLPYINLGVEGVASWLRRLWRESAGGPATQTTQEVAPGRPEAVPDTTI